MAYIVVTGKAIADSTGVKIEMPVLLSSEGVIVPLIDYLLTVRRSISWQNKLLRAAKLFLEYMDVVALPDEKEWRIFRNFSNALREGTVDRNTHDDPTGLFWSPLGPQVRKEIISQLSDFFDWLGKDNVPRAKEFNPHYLGNTYDRKIDLLAYKYRRERAFLGHSWSGFSQRTGRVIRSELPPKILQHRPLAFPEEKFEELLFNGFKVGGKYDFRGMAITCLLMGGGLRTSEPFHMYMCDVHPHWADPSAPFVAIHHPSDGFAPSDWMNRVGRRATRREYLATEFGLAPRHIIRGKKHAGWKEPALDDKWYMQVHWFPKDRYGYLFFQIWKRYLEQIVSVERTHPYAWINLDRKYLGEMYTISTYLTAFKAAVERIGLNYGKFFGTSAHGTRHAYGQRARQGKIHQVILQRMMHHRSPDSQLVYTQPEMKETVEAIANAAKRLAENAPHVFNTRFDWGDF